MWITILLSSLWFELGTWTGFLLSKAFQVGRSEILINGSRAARKLPVPFVDKHLRTKSLRASKFDRMVSSKLARGLRLLTEFDAFEAILLYQFQSARSVTPTKVRLHV